MGELCGIGTAEAIAMTHQEADPMSGRGRMPKVYEIGLPRSGPGDLYRHLHVNDDFVPAGSDKGGAAAERDDDLDEHPYSGIWEDHGPHSVSRALGLESVAQRWEALERDVLDGMYSHFMADTVGSLCTASC